MEYRQVRGIDNEIDPNTIKGTTDDGIEMWIPNDPGNRDWREYQAWLEEGNEPLPPLGVPVPPIIEPQPPDIVEVNAQVQDIDRRLSELEDMVASGKR